MSGLALRDGRRIALAAVAPFAIALLLAGALRVTSPGHGIGFVAGTAGVAAAVLPALYPLRRRLLAWPLNTAAQWLAVHTAAGAVLLPLALLHEGFRRPSGWLGWSLLAAAAWATGWGWLALYRERTLPMRTLQADFPATAFDAMAHRLRRLTAVHVPAAVLLIALIAFHLFAVWYF